MPAPALPNNASLTTIRDELIFTKSVIAATPAVAAHGAVVQKLLAEWTTVHATQLEHWDAITAADALIAAADSALDDFIVEFAVAMDGVEGKGTNGPLRKLYFKVAPYQLAAPVLGAELSELQRWQTLLAKEKSAPLAAMKKRLDPLIKRATAAVTARTEAASANEHFRARGDLAKYVTSVQTKRDVIAAAIDSFAAKEGNVPRGYSSRFFRHRTVRLSAEAKATRATKLAADRQAKIDAAAKVKSAQAKVKAALQELRSAKSGK